MPAALTYSILVRACRIFASAAFPTQFAATKLSNASSRAAPFLFQAPHKLGNWPLLASATTIRFIFAHSYPQKGFRLLASFTATPMNQVSDIKRLSQGLKFGLEMFRQDVKLGLFAGTKHKADSRHTCDSWQVAPFINATKTKQLKLS